MGSKESIAEPETSSGALQKLANLLPKATVGSPSAETGKRGYHPNRREYGVAHQAAKWGGYRERASFP